MEQGGISRMDARGGRGNYAEGKFHGGWKYAEAVATRENGLRRGSYWKIHDARTHAIHTGIRDPTSSV